jgi:hypothetical protein
MQKHVENGASVGPADDEGQPWTLEACWQLIEASRERRGLPAQLTTDERRLSLGECELLLAWERVAEFDFNVAETPSHDPRPRDHHFIPVFYLKRWAGADHKLFEYTIKRGTLVRKPVGPRATGFERDLYSFSDLNSVIASYLESVFLKRTDNLASIALKKLLTEPSSFPDELRSAWSSFVINLLVRHPDPFTELKQYNLDPWKYDESVQAAYERFRKPNSPPTFKEYSFTLLSTPARIRALVACLEDTTIHDRVNNMVWGVLDLSPAKHLLLTSDWPVTRNLTEGDRGHIAVPISPRHLFIAADDRSMIQHLRTHPPDTIVRVANFGVVSKARRYVYSFDKSQERFISNHMSCNMAQPPFFRDLERLDPFRDPF